MGIDLNIDWKGFAAVTLGVFKVKISGYLKDHADSEKFLEDCAEQIAKLTLKRAIPGLSPAELADVDEEIASYKDAMKLTVDSVLLDAEGLSKSTFLEILDVVFEFAVKAAPVLLSLGSHAV